jgi:hypothetical protein
MGTALKTLYFNEFWKPLVFLLHTPPDFLGGEKVLKPKAFR